MITVIDILLTLLQALVSAIGLYALLLGVAGFTRKKEQRIHKAQKSFAILIAAHNEEAVIGALLDNLRMVHYPEELYDVFVICDNCSDQTAAIAKSYSVNAMERFNAKKRGKGHAIEWMLEKLWSHERSYDAVILLDADNLVSSNFLLEMNEKLCRGYRVVQGYLETKNPYDSWITLSYALMYWYMNRVWQLARYQMHLPNVLGGTGIAIDTDLLQEIGWEARSLTEDVEFTARCVERGIFPTWAHEAIVYDEKPITLMGSLRQRLRWMQGHFFCAKHYFGKLVKLALKNRNWGQLDAALYLFQPYRILLYIVCIFMLYVQVFTSSIHMWGLRELLPSWFWVTLSVLLYLQTPLVLFIERKPVKAYFVYLLPYQLFLLTWFPLTAWAFFTSGNQNWSHTKHTRAITIDEIT